MTTAGFSMTDPPPPSPGPLLGESEVMAAVRSFLERAAGVSVPVLLVGESGTGKSHLARLLHRKSPRSDAPFVSVNCAGVPDGLFESEFFGHRRGAFTGATESRPGLFERASGGTLFLDEVGELPHHQQAKLLAVLDDGRVRRVGGSRVRQVDVRIVAATCRDLEAAVREGTFRADLFHRLALLRCEIPPLRARPGDLEGLIGYFLDVFARRHGVGRPALEPGAHALLRGHRWPGNVRELAHVLEAALILAEGPALGAPLLSRVLVGEPGKFPPRSGLDEPAAGSPRRRRYSFFGTAEEEKEIIRRALARHRGNRTRAARELGMSRNTLRQRMRTYGL